MRLRCSTCAAKVAAVVGSTARDQDASVVIACTVSCCCFGDSFSITIMKVVSTILTSTELGLRLPHRPRHCPGPYPYRTAAKVTEMTQYRTCTDPVLNSTNWY
ncbi:UNVERIFIED_CONTAM: hypothetical protein FKN15_000850 [Acipenser sinensis]